MKRTRRTKKILAMLTVIVLLMSMLSSVPAAAETGDKKLTLMVYLCGSNLESDGGSATADITEMLHSRFDSSQVNVLVMAGGSARWWSSFSADDTGIYEVAGSRPKLVQSNGLLNMGEASTLSLLLNYGYENYPAENYALIMWDHGGGPLRGACWDTLSNSDNLTLPEIQDALDNSPFAGEKLSWIGFDACLMASVEVACALEPYAEYLIASEETEPGSGWDYAFLKGIEADENGAATGTSIAQSYQASLENSGADYTLSCVRLDRIGAVEDALDGYFGDLTVTLTADTYALFSEDRRASKSYGRSDIGDSDHDLVDLYDLVNHYSVQDPEGADAVLTALDDAIVCSVSNTEGSHGISAYHPFYNKSGYERLWQTAYAGLYFCPGYTSYIQDFGGILTGASAAEWDRLDTQEMLVDNEEGETLQYFTVQLSQEQVSTFSYAQLIVLSRSSIDHYDESYSFVYTQDSGVELDSRGMLSVEYGGRMLYALNGVGEVTTGGLMYDVTDDGRYVVWVNIATDDYDDGVETLYCYMLCDLNEETNELEMASLYVWDNVTQSYTNRIEPDLSQYDTMYFYYQWYNETRDADGVLLPFTEWNQDNHIVGSNTCSCDKFPELRLQFRDELQTGSELYAAFLITDVQNRTRMTELMPFDNPYVTEYAPTAELEENDYITLDGALLRVTNADLDKNLSISLGITNTSDRELDVTLRELVLNGQLSIDGIATLDTMGGRNYGMPAGGFGTVYKEIDEIYDLSELTSISFILEVTDSLSDRSYGRYPVTIDLENMDVGFLRAEGQNEALASGTMTTEDGTVLNLELLTIEEREDGYLTGQLRIENTGTAAQQDYITLDCYVNGCNAGYFAIDYDLQPGAYVYTDYRISNQENMYLSDDYVSIEGYTSYYANDLISAHGITKIGRISGKSKYYNTAFELNFTEPCTYASDAASSSLPMLEEYNGVSAQLLGACVVDSDVILKARVCNAGSEPCTLMTRSWTIESQQNDSESYSTYGHYITVPADSAVIGFITLENAAESAYISEAAVRFSVYDTDDSWNLYDDSYLCAQYGEAVIRFNEPVECFVSGGTELTAEVMTTEAAAAEAFQPRDDIADYTYELLDDGTAMITGYTGGAYDITLPAELDGYTVTKIDTGAFYGQNTLRSVVIPETVVYLGGLAFLSCERLEKVEILGNIENLGSNPFSGCPALQSIVLAPVNDILVLEDEVLFAQTETNRYLIYYPLRLTAESYTVPEGTTVIFGSAFDGCASLKEIIIPDSVTRMDSYAFSDCASLVSMAMPEGMTTVPAGIFNGCASLESVTLPVEAAEIGDSAFCGCENLREIELPAGVTSIGASAFENCALIEELAIPEGVTEIGYNAFYGCSRLRKLVIPSGVTELDFFTFSHCEALESIVLPENLLSLGNSAFYACGALRSVIIPDSVSEFGESLFEGCESLESVTLPAGMTEIPKRMFYGCGELTGITLPETVTTIGDSAFCDCSYLSDIALPDAVTSIGKAAFYNCMSLESIVIPDGVTEIPEDAFYSCKSLSSVTIPDSVMSIGDEAFYDTKSLKEIRIPASVTTFGSDVFANIMGNEEHTVITTPGSAAEAYAKENGYPVKYE